MATLPINTIGKFKPTGSTRQYFGNLKIEKKSLAITLKLAVTDSEALSNQVPKSLTGITGAGTCFLFSPTYASGHFSGPISEQTIKFYSAFICSGKLNSKTKFVHVSYAIGGLAYFFRESRIESGYKTDEKGQRMAFTHVHFNTENERSYELKDFKIKLHTTLQYAVPGYFDPYKREQSNQEKAFLTIENEKGFNINAILHYAELFERFIAFSTRTRSKTSEITCINPSEKLITQANYFSPYLQHNPKDFKKWAPNTMLLGYHLTEKEFPTIIAKWIILEKIHPHLYTNFFQSTKKENTLDHSIFLLLTGIESYADKKYKNILLREKKKKPYSIQKTKSIIDALPNNSALNQYLKGRLNDYLGTASTNARFKKVFSSLPIRISSLITSEDHELIMKIRTLIAHSGLSAADRLKVRQNHIQTKLKTVCEYLMLSELGISIEGEILDNLTNQIPH